MHHDQSHADRRETTRFALRLVASYRSPGQPRRPTRLLDLSSGGCRLLSSTPIERGTPVWLRIATREPIFGNIMWSHGRFSGMRFGETLPQADVEALVASHASLSERDITELRHLAQECARLAHSVELPEDGQHLAAIVSQCTSEVEAFESSIQRERARQDAMRTEALLARLSVRADAGAEFGGAEFGA